MQSVVLACLLCSALAANSNLRAQPLSAPSLPMAPPASLGPKVVTKVVLAKAAAKAVAEQTTAVAEAQEVLSATRMSTQNKAKEVLAKVVLAKTTAVAEADSQNINDADAGDEGEGTDADVATSDGNTEEPEEEQHREKTQEDPSDVDPNELLENPEASPADDELTDTEKMAQGGESLAVDEEDEGSGEDDAQGGESDGEDADIEGVDSDDEAAEEAPLAEPTALLEDDAKPTKAKPTKKKPEIQYDKKEFEKDWHNEWKNGDYPGYKKTYSKDTFPGRKAIVAAEDAQSDGKPGHAGLSGPDVGAYLKHFKDGTIMR